MPLTTEKPAVDFDRDVVTDLPQNWEIRTISQPNLKASVEFGLVARKRHSSLSL